MSERDSKIWQDLGDQFTLMVGNCITQWALVEDALFEICWRALQSPRERAAIVYYRSPTIDTRMNLTDELVRSALPKRERQSGGHDHPDIKLWDKLVSDFKKLLRIRSQIAHQPLMWRLGQTGAADPAGRPIVESWFEIYVSRTEALRAGASKYKPLRIEDLQKHLVNVSQIAGRLYDFARLTLPRHAATSP
jgi:hypothetical protein